MDSIDEAPTTGPWLVLMHEGERHLVRFMKECVWVNRVRDREMWLFDGKAAPRWVCEALA